MILGVTGGMGMGKSTVCSWFVARGWQLISSDQLAREALEDPQVQGQLTATLSHNLFQNNQVNKSALSSLVQNNPYALAQLEAILHPWIHDRRQMLLNQDPQANWVLEIPLLFEKKLESLCQSIVCIMCSQEEQQARLLHKGVSQADIQFRLSHQLPIDQKAQLSQYVILNQGDSYYRELQLNFLLKRLI